MYICAFVELLKGDSTQCGIQLMSMILQQTNFRFLNVIDSDLCLYFEKKYIGKTKRENFKKYFTFSWIFWFRAFSTNDQVIFDYELYISFKKTLHHTQMNQGDCLISSNICFISFSLNAFLITNNSEQQKHKRSRNI